MVHHGGMNSANHVRQAPLPGSFNRNEFLHEKDGTLWLRRETKGGAKDVLRNLQDEFAGYGWLDRGNTVRKRSVQEQVSLQTAARILGLLVLGGAKEDRGTMVIPYIDNAESIDQFLAKSNPQEAQKMIQALYDDLYIAHANNIIYGDRWSENILVKKGLHPQAIHIDFDLQYEGPDACALEVGRMTFYLLHAGREKVRTAISDALHNRRDSLNLSLVETIIRGHTRQFEKGRFSGAENEVDALFYELHKKEHHV